MMEKRKLHQRASSSRISFNTNSILHALLLFSHGYMQCWSSMIIKRENYLKRRYFYLTRCSCLNTEHITQRGGWEEGSIRVSAKERRKTWFWSITHKEEEKKYDFVKKRKKKCSKITTYAPFSSLLKIALFNINPLLYGTSIFY